MRSSKARSLTAAMPPSPSRLGLPYVPVASSTTSAWAIASRPSALSTSRRNGRRARRALADRLVLEQPLAADRQHAGRAADAPAQGGQRGDRLEQLARRCSSPVGSAAPRGASGSAARTRGETFMSHGVNVRTWPQRRTCPPTAGAASKTVKSSPRAAAASAASRPIGPAPRMAMRVTSAPRLISSCPGDARYSDDAEDRRIRRRVRQSVRAARAAGRRPRARVRRAVLPRRPRWLRRRVRRGLAAAARPRRALHRRQLRRRDRPRRRGLRLRLRRPARQRLRPAHVRLHAGAHGRGVRGLDGGAARRAARASSAASTCTWSTARRWPSTTSCGSRSTTTSSRCACAPAGRSCCCARTRGSRGRASSPARGSSTSARSGGRPTTGARRSGTR